MKGKNNKNMNFNDFLTKSVSKELQYFILDSEFSKAFTYRIKKIFLDIKDKKSNNIEFSVMFNTKGNIALIDADVIGRYISNNYDIFLKQYYKKNSLKSIIQYIINGNEKVQRDYIIISYNILYKTLKEIYKYIKYKKEIVDKYIIKYKLEDYDRHDIALIISSILILEDMSLYIGLKQEILLAYINKIIMKKI